MEAFSKKTIRKPELAWDTLSAAEIRQAFDFAEGYKRFLDAAKTERRAVALIQKSPE